MAMMDITMTGIYEEEEGFEAEETDDEASGDEGS